MDITQINLNLLVAFDAVMATRSVTQAGKRLGISQSGVSNTLKKLRKLFQDELFIHEPGQKLKPTSKAMSLAPRIRELLRQTETIFNESTPFSPKTSKRKFTIGMSDYTEDLLLPYLWGKIKKQAPHIQLVIKHFNYLTDIQSLDIRQIDLIIGDFEIKPESFMQQTLFEDTMVCAGCADNLLFNNKMTLNDYLSAYHIQTKYRSDSTVCLSDAMIEKMGYKRKIAFTVPHILISLHMLTGTQLISTISKRIIKKYASLLNLKYQPTPFKLQKVTTSQLWHKLHQMEPGHMWLRSLMKSAAADIQKQK